MVVVLVLVVVILVVVGIVVVVGVLVVVLIVVVILVVIVVVALVVLVVVVVIILILIIPPLVVVVALVLGLAVVVVLGLVVVVAFLRVRLRGFLLGGRLHCVFQEIWHCHLFFGRLGRRKSGSSDGRSYWLDRGCLWRFHLLGFFLVEESLLGSWSALVPLEAWLVKVGVHV